MAENKRKLNARQAQFVEEYLVDLNATEAAKRAGYSENTARSIGAENLTKPDIASAIQERMTQRSERTEITADMVLQGIVMNIRRCEQGAAVYDRSGNPVMTEGPGGNTAPMWKYDATSVLKGYELLGKHLKLFTDKHEHSGPDGGPIEQRTTIDASGLSDSTLDDLMRARQKSE